MDLTVFLSILLFIIVILLLALLIYSGLLTDISVDARKSPYDELLVYYKTHIGPYSNVGDLFQATHRLAPGLRLIGIYLDDPKFTVGSRCRAAIGAIVTDPVSDAESVKRLTEAGYATKTLPKVDSVVHCTFPMVNMVSMYIAIWRVYPAIRDYLLAKELTARPCIEVYEDSRIVFFAPLSRYDEFEPPIRVPTPPPPPPQQQPRVETPPSMVEERVAAAQFAQQQEAAAPAPAPANTEALISEAVAEASQSSRSTTEEVETVFENKSDLLDAMADRPDDVAVAAPPAAEEEEEEEEVPPKVEEEMVEQQQEQQQQQQEAAAAEETGEGELAALEQRLAQLEEDLTDKQSRVRDDASQLNNSLALAEIEEHLRRTAPPPETDDAASPDQGQGQEAPAPAAKDERPPEGPPPEPVPAEEQQLLSLEPEEEEQEEPNKLSESSEAAQELQPAQQPGSEAQSQSVTIPPIRLQPSEPIDPPTTGSGMEAEAPAAQQQQQQPDPEQVGQFVQSVVQRAQQICESAAAEAAAAAPASVADATERREKRLPSPMRHQADRSSLRDSLEADLTG